MNILIASKGGDGLALGLRLQDEGHEVSIAIEKPDAQRAGEGLLAHVDDPVATARDGDTDLVIFDMVGMGGMADALRDLGVPILGASRALDLIELDRIRGLQIFQGLGLALPETRIFEDANFDQALDVVRKDNGRWVFKPCGNLGTDKTFIAGDAEEMIEYLEHTRESAKGEDVKFPAFLLQRFVDGIEVSVERWYSQGRPMPALDNMTFEEKKFLAGNLGPAIGCAGNVVLAPDPHLVARTVARLDKFAARHGITGPIDLNTIVTDTGIPHVLEATARFGYDALWAFLRLWKMPIGETLLSLAEGDEDIAVDLAAQVAAAVRVSVPPYPGGDAKQARGTPVVDDILDDPAIWPGDVMLTEEGRLVVAGVDGVVYIVTGTGDTPADAYAQCYHWLDDARLPDRQYRIDLAERVTRDLDRLQRIGYRMEGAVHAHR